MRESTKGDSPYAGLLWLEFMASPEAQRWLNPHTTDPYSSLDNCPLANPRKEGVLGRLSHVPKLGEYQEKVFEAFGFPKAESGK